MKLLLENWRSYLTEDGLPNNAEGFYADIGYSGQKTLYDFEGGCQVMVMFETVPDGVDLNLIEIVGDDCLRKGYATEVLERIVNAADKHGIRLSLGVQPIDGKIDFKTLDSWYERFGFETEHDDYPTNDRVRIPKSAGRV